MKNVIFDMGNVLIRFDPESFLDREGILDPEDRTLMMNAVFLSPEWPMQDKGTIDEAGLLGIVRGRLPARLHESARRLIFAWEKLSEPIPGMAGFVRECKAAGLGIYLLSNASIRQPSYWPDIPGSECFDGTVISAYERLLKPSPEIYRLLLRRFRLAAEDCLFVDDTPANVEGARAVGMQGFHFTGDVPALRAYCRKAGFLPAE